MKKEFLVIFILFDLIIVFFGYYIVFLKDVFSRCFFVGIFWNNYKEIVFDFIFFLESKFVSFKNFVYLGLFDIINVEIFRDVVVIVFYNEKWSYYYVVEICYDFSLVDLFLNIDVVGIFVEYFKICYDVEVFLD